MEISEYLEIVGNIKAQIASAQQRVILNANKELVMLYWNIGKTINKHKTWGSKFIENMARDIKSAFPNQRGFSERNLKYMSKFANIYNDLEIMQKVSAQLSWSHNVALLDKIKDDKERLWYAEKTIENGWSLNIMHLQIDSKLYERQVIANKTTNFKDKLPYPQNELAQQILKDPYNFDFMEYREGMIERDIENELVDNIAKFLLELGTGFSFVGQQYHLEVDNEDFYIDLLFYHLELRCYVVIELKTGVFKPEYAGKLNFYISAVDDLLKKPMDNPTIGILLCRDKKKLIAEYALRNLSSPIGVSEFKMTSMLPKELEDILPTAEDIENRLKLLNIDSSELSG